MSKELVMYNKQLKLNLPEEFQETENVENYFLGAKPEFIYVYEEKKAFISVTLTQEKSHTEDFEQRIKQYCVLYNRTVPNFGNCGIAKKNLSNGIPIGAFHYTSTSAERDLFNYFVLTSLNERELVISMHCSIEDSPKLALKFMNLLNSIEVKFETKR